MDERRVNSRLIPIALLLFGGYLILGELTGLRLPCLFHQLTGFDCPGCGSQRALHSLIHGHPLEAWSYNLLLPFIILYILLLLLLPAACPSGKGGAADSPALTLSPFRKTCSRLYNLLYSPSASLTLLAVIILWWVIRNILHV